MQCKSDRDLRPSQEEAGEEGLTDSDQSGSTSASVADLQPDFAEEGEDLHDTPWVHSNRKSPFGHLVKPYMHFADHSGLEGWALPACSRSDRPLQQGGQEGYGLATLYARGRTLCPSCLPLLEGSAFSEFNKIVSEHKGAS